MFLCQIVFLAYVNTDPKFMYSNFRVDANNAGAYPPARPDESVRQPDIIPARTPACTYSGRYRSVRAGWRGRARLYQPGHQPEGRIHQ